MTFMAPSYQLVHGMDGHPLYRLYEYHDGPVTSSTGPTSMVVFFVPGSAGSHEQCRSLGTMLQKGDANARVFTVDFRGEMSAHLPHSLQQQTSYILKAIAFLKAQCPAQRMAIVGHSMGGYMAYSLAPKLKSAVDVIILLSAPVAKLPLPAIIPEKSFVVSDDYDGPFIVSIGGSHYDVQIPPDLSKPAKLSDRVHYYRAEQVPFAWSAPNHVVMVWDAGLLSAISDYLLQGQYHRADDYFSSCSLAFDKNRMDGASDLFNMDLLSHLDCNEEHIFRVDQALDLVTSWKLGREMEVAGECLQAKAIPGAYFPETAFSRKTQSLHPTFLTVLSIGANCKFAWKRLCGRNRASHAIHARSDAYYRQYSPFVDIFDEPWHSKTAIDKIDILSSVSTQTYKIDKWGRIKKLKIRIRKDLTNNDVVVIKSIDVSGLEHYYNAYHSESKFTMSDARQLVVMKSFKEPIEIHVSTDYLASLSDVLLKEHYWLVVGVSLAHSVPLFLVVAFFTKGLSSFVVLLVTYSLCSLTTKPFRPRRLSLYYSLPAVLLPYPLSVLVPTAAFYRHPAALLPFVYDIFALLCFFKDVAQARTWVPHTSILQNVTMLSAISLIPAVNRRIRCFAQPLIYAALVFFGLHPTWFLFFTLPLGSMPK
jgi:pimeloyl-ACP methyl ester carboxylesterase